MSSRRDFIAKIGSAAALAAVGSPSVLAALERYPRAGDPRLKALAAAALDAARAAGCTYADVRFTLTRSELLSVGSPTVLTNWSLAGDELHAAVGVRVLVDGAWGFASSNVWSADESARLAREATAQARTNGRGRRRRVELGQPLPATTAEWVQPVKVDPFTVPLGEKLDILWALGDAVLRVEAPVQVNQQSQLYAKRQEKTFASTDGSFLTQTTYLVHPFLQVFAIAEGRFAQRTFDALQPVAGGWEVVTAHSLFGQVPQLVDETVAMLQAEPIEADRYDIVVDARTAACIVGQTIGVAAELDRVLGYEANAGGTSYLAPPEKQLGQFALGPSSLNVVANRSRPGAPGTVKWDDDGVVPDEYSVIKDGVLVDYHTTRDVLMPGGRSHGCSGSLTATHASLVLTPNIAMLPGEGSTTFEDLVNGLERGIVVVGGAPFPRTVGAVTVDRQQLNGEITGNLVYEVRKGKRTRFIRNSEVLFRSPELWKGLAGIGGRGTQQWSAQRVSKGQPAQDYMFGIAGVPARFNRVAITDRSRLA